MNNTIRIEKLQLQDLEEVIAYVLQCRELLFPMLVASPLPTDLVQFKQFYIEDKQGVFLVARTGEGELVGTIGMRGYDHRFLSLDYGQQRVVEVTRLFVASNYRKRGLGTALFLELHKEAKKRNIDRMYLHTHPFLSGAQQFWEKQGFGLLSETVESDFTTLHMNLTL